MAPRKKRAYGISSWITRAVLQELEAQGVPADELLKRHRLNRSDLLDPDGWVPLASHRAFYRDAIAASGDPAFQVKVGRRVPVHVTRAAGYCAAVSSTLGEAIEVFGRFSELLVDGSRVGALRTPASRRGVREEAGVVSGPRGRPLLRRGRPRLLPARHWTAGEGDPDPDDRAPPWCPRMPWRPSSARRSPGTRATSRCTSRRERSTRRSCTPTRS